MINEGYDDRPLKLFKDPGRAFILMLRALNRTIPEPVVHLQTIPDLTHKIYEIGVYFEPSPDPVNLIPRGIEKKEKIINRKAKELGATCKPVHIGFHNSGTVNHTIYTFPR